MDKLEDLILFLVNGKYDCFIDCGGFLRNNDDSFTFLEKWFNMEQTTNTKFQGILYFDKNYQMRLYSKQNQKMKIESTLILSAPPKTFLYYYSQANIRGTHIPQLGYLKGLCSIADHVFFEDVAQAIFRLQFLFYGQTIHFILFSPEGMEISRFIHNKDKK